MPTFWIQYSECSSIDDQFDTTVMYIIKIYYCIKIYELIDLKLVDSSLREGFAKFIENWNRRNNRFERWCHSFVWIFPKVFWTVRNFAIWWFSMKQGFIWLSHYSIRSLKHVITGLIQNVNYYHGLILNTFYPFSVCLIFLLLNVRVISSRYSQCRRQWSVSLGSDNSRCSEWTLHFARRVFQRR